SGGEGRDQTWRGSGGGKWREDWVAHRRHNLRNAAASCKNFEPPALRASIRTMKRFERLGQARTPDGTLIELFRHDGAYLLRADGVELMSTRRHLSEDRLAEVACAHLRDTERARVLIGGLGLGFTLRAALNALGDDAEVVVAELLPEVVAWNSDARYGISAAAMSDP